VVDNARKAIGKTIDISVTSVLQTTAGKMISENGTSAWRSARTRLLGPSPVLRNPRLRLRNRSRLSWNHRASKHR